MKKEEGFTLIETLLVLSIVSLMISLPILQFRQLKIEAETQLFFESLGASITLMQNHAIINNEWTAMETKPDNREIQFRVPRDRNHPLGHRLYLPDSISMPGNTREFTFSSGSGTQGNIEKFRFHTAKGIVECQFLFGSGRFTYAYI